MLRHISEVCSVLIPSTRDRRSHFREPLQRSLRDFNTLLSTKDQRVLCIPFSKCGIEGMSYHIVINTSILPNVTLYEVNCKL